MKRALFGLLLLTGCMHANVETRRDGSHSITMVGRHWVSYPAARDAAVKACNGHNPVEWNEQDIGDAIARPEYTYTFRCE